VIGKISYCSQEPWIFNGSIQQMILCGNEMDSERYHRVIQATALERDFKQLPLGDSSIIGEGGVSLSGGQKTRVNLARCLSRVNLARCLYVDADIYLLDDPLSAVDAHVSDHIFQKVIRDLLRSKICILVTHQLQHLKDMDHDPLSAVDAHVSDHIFQKVIKDLLRSKICILVTHQLQHLKDMDHVILLKSVYQLQNVCIKCHS